LDRYPFKVGIKGSFSEFVAREVVITGNSSLRHAYCHASPRHIEALERRLSVNVEMEEGDYEKGTIRKSIEDAWEAAEKVDAMVVQDGATPTPQEEKETTIHLDNNARPDGDRREAAEEER
jgi:hypothetical protein